MAHSDLKFWFDIALKSAKMDYSDFGQEAARRVGRTKPYTRQFVSQVVRDKLQSPVLQKLIIEFLCDRLPVVHSKLDNLKRIGHPFYVSNVA